VRPKSLDILYKGVENSVEEAASIPDQIPLRRLFLTKHYVTLTIYKEFKFSRGMI